MTAFRPSSEPGSLPSGTLVGHYSIVEKLGQGGEAIVYRARDLVLERDVALKTPRCESVSPRERSHLLKEARAASRLSHPRIVPIHEVFEDQGKPWFAMGLVEGSTLRTVLAQRGALPAEDVARYGEMLADALHAAHSKHILHRDVTPGNIFITPDGRLLLADFGLAFVPAGPEATTTAVSYGRLAGTLGYMSPEQMTGREVGPQSDVFSAGVVLYQMATGERPFRGSTLGEVLDAVLNRPLPPMPRDRYIPAGLQHVISKALAKRLDERYASAEEMFVDLRALRRRFESSGTSPEAVDAPRRWTRKRAAALGGLAILAVVAAIAAPSWRLLHSTGLPQAVPFQVTTRSGWQAEAKISPAGSDIAYVAEGPDGNVDIWLVDAKGGNPIRLTDDAAADRSPTWFPDGSAIAFVSERGGAPGVWKVPRLGGQSPTPIIAAAESPAISPDGSRIAFTRPDAAGNRRIFVAPLDDISKARVLTGDRDGLWNHESPAWSPDGRTICYAAQTDLWTVPADGSGRPAKLTTDGEADFEPAWSPDGRWVYFSSMRGHTTAIWRVPAQGGAPERVTMGSGPERQPSLSEDGSRLTYSTLSLNSNLVVRVEKTGKEYEFGGERRELYPTFAPDGLAIAYASDQLKSPPDLWIQALGPDGAPRGQPRRLTDHPGSAAFPSCSPDGRWLTYHRVLNGQRHLWIVPVAGGTSIQLTDDPAVDVHPAWSPDGRQIAFVSERGGGSHIWLIPVADGKAAGPARQLTTGPLSNDEPSWSPDSSTVAYIATDAAGTGDVWLVDARTTGPGRQLTHGAGARAATWSGATRQLLVSGTWGTGQMRLMSVDALTGQPVLAGPPNLFGEQSSESGDFDISRDARLLVVVRQIARGNIWVLEATRGRF